MSVPTLSSRSHRHPHCSKDPKDPVTQSLETSPAPHLRDAFLPQGFNHGLGDEAIGKTVRHGLSFFLAGGRGKTETGMVRMVVAGLTWRQGNGNNGEWVKSGGRLTLSQTRILLKIGTWKWRRWNERGRTAKVNNNGASEWREFLVTYKWRGGYSGRWHRQRTGVSEEKGHLEMKAKAERARKRDRWYETKSWKETMHRDKKGNENTNKHLVGAGENWRRRSHDDEVTRWCRSPDNGTMPWCAVCVGVGKWFPSFILFEFTRYHEVPFYLIQLEPNTTVNLGNTVSPW